MSGASIDSGVKCLTPFSQYANNESLGQPACSVSQAATAFSSSRAKIKLLLQCGGLSAAEVFGTERINVNSIRAFDDRGGSYVR